MSVKISIEAMKWIRSVYEKDGMLQGQFFIGEMQSAFVAGAEWQQEQDAKRGPRSVSGVGDAPWRLSKCETTDEAKAEVLPDQAGGIRVEWIKGQPCFIGFGDAHAINTLIASIRDQKMDVEKAAINSDCVTEAIVKPRNPREPESADPVIGWLKEIGDKLYHVSTRQETIDIEQRRMMGEILDLMRPEVNGCEEPERKPSSVTECFFPDGSLGLFGGEAPEGVTLNLGLGSILKGLYIRPVRPEDYAECKRLSFGGEFSRLVKGAYTKAPPVVTRMDQAPEVTPLEDISDELLDQMKEQIPVSVYVAEMARRKQVQNVVKDERDVKIEELQAEAFALEKRLHFYRLLAKSRAAALNAVYGELDSFEA